MTTYSYTRYLSAKKTVDDRALNVGVVDGLRNGLASLQRPRVLEIGAGLGTMVARAVDWKLIREAEYTLLDVDSESLLAARLWLSTWAARSGLRVETRESNALWVGRDDVDVTVYFAHADLETFLAIQGASRSWDLVAANAFLDLVDTETILPRLFGLVRPQGLFWFTINFDGETIFEPSHPDDSLLLAIYHRSMDERTRDGRPAGHSKTGRRLFGHLSSAGATVDSVGSSDWVVHPRGGSYPDDEEYFVRCILQTINDELGHSSVDRLVLQEWIAARIGQLDRAQLIYMTHQLDFFGRAP